MLDGLMERTGHKAAPGLGNQQFGRLAEFLFQEVVLLAGNAESLLSIGKGLYISHDVVLMLQQADG